METHTLRSVQELLGLSRSALMRLIDLGFVKPRRGARQAYLFSFQDIVLIRTAEELRAANIPTRKILRALQRLKAQLPDEAPLTGLRITAIGQDIVVQSRDARWAADTGQLLMDFDVRMDGGRNPDSVVRPFAQARAARREAPLQRVASPDELFARAEALEEVDEEAAKRIYAQAIASAPDYTNAYLNLGAMLCENGDCREAVQLFTAGIGHCPGESLLYFNRAVALEDLKKFPEALADYDRALQLDPNLADAHFNAARLHDALGHQQRAIRHFSAYRRLSK